MKLKSLLFLSLLFLTLTASAQTAEELNAKGEEYYFAGDYTKAVEYFQNPPSKETPLRNVTLHSAMKMALE